MVSIIYLCCVFATNDTFELYLHFFFASKVTVQFYMRDITAIVSCLHNILYLGFRGLCQQESEYHNCSSWQLW